MTPRVRLMVTLAAYMGLRAAEIARVHNRDVRGDQLHVVRKGGAETVMQIHPIVAAAAAGIPAVGWWFPSPAEPGPADAGRVGVDVQLGRVLRRAKVVGGSGHRLRHWNGTTQLDQDGEPAGRAGEPRPRLGHHDAALHPRRRRRPARGYPRVAGPAACRSGVERPGPSPSVSLPTSISSRTRVTAVTTSANTTQIRTDDQHGYCPGWVEALSLAVMTAAARASYSACPMSRVCPARAQSQEPCRAPRRAGSGT